MPLLYISPYSIKVFNNGTIKVSGQSVSDLSLRQLFLFKITFFKKKKKKLNINFYYLF